MKRGNTTYADGGLSQLDRYLRALSDKHRRYLLYYLHENEAANIEELSRYVAAWEADRTPSKIDNEDWKPVQTELHHNHLPRLEEYGLVDYDERSDDVCLDNPPQVFKMLLQFCRLIEREIDGTI